MSSDSFMYLQVFELENTDLFLQKTWKTFIYIFIQSTNVHSWGFSITVVPPMNLGMLFINICC